MNFPVTLSQPLQELAEKLLIQPQDIEEAFVLGSGAGGQKINKTANCVHLKHLPTGTEVRCQNHRERERNRKDAYVLLIRKIEEQVLGKESKLAQKRFKIRKQKQRRSRRSKEKMLKEKHRRSEIKESRKSPKLDA